MYCQTVIDVMTVKLLLDPIADSALFACSSSCNRSFAKLASTTRRPHPRLRLYRTHYQL